MLLRACSMVTICSSSSAREASRSARRAFSTSQSHGLSNRSPHTVKSDNARVRASTCALITHVEVVLVVLVVLEVLEVEVVLVVVLVVVLRSVMQRLTLSKAGLAPAPLKRSATRTRWPR